jgi:hypothetical protein
VELALRRRHRELPGTRVRFEDEPPSLLDHPGRDHEVVGDGRVAGRRIERSPDRVETAVGRNDTAAAGFQRLEPRVVAPIEVLAPAARLAAGLDPIARVPGRTAYSRIGEVPHEGAKRAALDHRVRVGEDHDLTAGLGDRVGEGGQLPAPRQSEEPDAGLGVPLDDRLRSVGRTVRRDDNLEPLPRVVSLQRVVDALLDACLLVIRRDDKTDRRRDRPLKNAAPA